MARPPKYEERSEEIMRAFELCVIRQGLGCTTLSDVAFEAGLPRSLVRYFMGNRDDMVDRLIERMMTRAEASLSRIRDHDGSANLEGLLDLYFTEVFDSELSNAVMGELWYLARNDEHIRQRLQGVYDYALDLLVAAMEREGIGASGEHRRSAAFAVLSLALGQSSLRDFHIVPPDRDATRRAAGLIIMQHKTTERAK